MADNVQYALSEEQRLLQETLRAFARDKVAPRAAEIDAKAEYPQDMFDALRELGMFALPFPEAYGGANSMLSACLAIEELGRICYNTAYLLIVQWTPFCAVLYGGTEEQKERFLPGLGSGELRAAISVTEPGAGSDVAGIKTRTDRTDGGLVSAELETETGAWHFATQRDAALRTAGRVSTDAAFAAVGRDGEAATRWGMVRGTSLAWDGLPLVTSDVPLTVSADFRAPWSPTLAIAPFEGTATVTVQLLPPDVAPQSVRLDGTALAFEHLGAGRVRVVLTEAGTLDVTTDVAVSTERASGAPRLRGSNR